MDLQGKLAAVQDDGGDLVGHGRRCRQQARFDSHSIAMTEQIKSIHHFPSALKNFALVALWVGAGLGPTFFASSDGLDAATAAGLNLIERKTNP